LAFSVLDIKTAELVESVGRVSRYSLEQPAEKVSNAALPRVNNIFFVFIT
jgi:hypothetical protein